jgi:hypothetical protein
VGKALTTACGGNFVSAFLNRNKRSAQWAVAPIEVAGFESRRVCIFYTKKDIIIAFEEIWNNLLTALS